MTQDEINEMVKQAGMAYEDDTDRYIANIDDLQDFAKLVAAHTLMNIDPKSSMSYREGYEAGLDAGRAEQQADMESLYAMYQQACKQRDMLMDQQRAQIAAIKGQIQ